MVAWRLEEVRPVLEQVTEMAKSGHLLVGYVAYEAAPAFDAALMCSPPTDGLPLVCFAAYPPSASSVTVRPRGEFMTGVWRQADQDENNKFNGRSGTNAAFDDRFAADMARIHADIADGRYYQVNYTSRLKAPFVGDGAACFDALRQHQPGAYSFFLDFSRWQICSVSPELFFHWQPAKSDGQSGQITTRPMKGTAPRALDPLADQQNAASLHQSAKDRAENLMIVDLLRNDLSRLAETGTVSVSGLFDVAAWATVWQMTSTVTARTRPGIGLPDIFAALFPCGSVTGAPKASAMQTITELEPTPRGVYCGAVGLVLPGGEARFNVAIRTVLVDQAKQQASYGVGSGIVWDSSVAGEAAEWRVKQRLLGLACPDYELLETLLWRRERYRWRAEHLARLAASARQLDFVFDERQIQRALDAHSARFETDTCYRVRLTLAPDGKIHLTTEPLHKPLHQSIHKSLPMALHSGKQLIGLAQQPVNSGNPWLRHKTSRRQIYESLALPGDFDTLLWNERREITEFTRGNVVVKRDGKLWTPALTCGLLAGTERAKLLARGVLREGIISVDEIQDADAIWFINSVRGAVPCALK